VSDVYRNPQKEKQDEEYEYRQQDAADYPTEIAGPGGRTTNIENNERGIIDATIWRAMATYRQADLGSDHNSQRQGIYRQDSGKYAD
jgi:hypothetical protein